MAAPNPPNFNAPNTQESTIRNGQKVDLQTGISQPFTEQDMQVSLAIGRLGQADVEITPTDRNSSLVRTYGIPTTELLTFSRKFIETGAIELPDTLTSPTAVYETNSGEGASSETATGASVGSNPNLSLAVTSSTQSSAAILPDLQILIKPNSRSVKPLLKILYYPQEADTFADILTSLSAIAGATVNAWPDFDGAKMPIAFTLKGQQASISAGATVKESISAGDTDTYIQSEGTSDSYQLGSSIKTINVPPTIHGALTITGATSHQDIDAVATATMEAGTNWNGLTQTETASATVNASVSPSSVDPTTIASIPATGLYLYKLSSELSPYFGYNTAYAIIFNFADL